MSSIFPLRETVTRDEQREPRLVDLDEENADEVFEALSSETTREIFLALHTSPQAASDLAEATGTSVQNVQYHLEKLTDADLVEVVDTWYSERGTEMKVYAPKDDSLVLFAGSDKRSTLRSLLDRVVGVFALLLPVSLLAGLGARLTNTEESATGPGTVDLDDPGAAGLQTDAPESPDYAPEGDEGGADLASETTDAVNGSDIVAGNDTAEMTETVLLEGDETVLVDNDTALILDDGARVAVDNATLTEQAGGLTAQARDTTAELAVEGNVLENGSAVTIPDVLVERSVDPATTVAGFEPAIAVAVGALIGGLTVAGALAAWYGTPGARRGNPETE
jgi:DNA-binding transcriptional ArsR family regulator